MGLVLTLFLAFVCSSSLSAQTVKELNEKQFRTLVADYTKAPKKFLGSKPCIVDVYATWCGPCKRLAPALQKAANTYGKRLTIYKVDIDKCPNLAAAYGIEYIPDVYFFAPGKKMWHVVGLDPEGLNKELKKLLKK